MREAFPNAVDVRVVHEADEPDETDPLDFAQVRRSPRDLFARYLEQKGVEGEELLKLFDRLLEELEDSDNDDAEGATD